MSRLRSHGVDKRKIERKNAAYGVLVTDWYKEQEATGRYCTIVLAEAISIQKSFHKEWLLAAHCFFAPEFKCNVQMHYSHQLITLIHTIYQLLYRYRSEHIKKATQVDKMRLH